MITLQLSIVELFASSLERELTINQVCKLLRKPYASVNKHMHELAAAGVLRQRQVGSALLCALNFSCEETIGLLTLLSIRRTAARRNDPKAHLPAVPDVAGLRPEAILFSAGHILVITEQPVRRARGFTPLSRAALTDRLRTLDLGETVVLQGHERFWRLVADQAAR